MGQEIATRDDGFAVAERGGNSLIKGTILKFADSTFKANKIEVIQQAPDGPAFVVVGIVTAWVHWKDGKPIEHKITRTGQTHPYREDFGDLDKAEWEIGIGGGPSDPHRDTRYVYLINVRSGKTYTFITDTHGGRQAVGELKDACTTVRQVRPGALPVVQLATRSMPSRFGLRPKPSFEIIDWRGGAPTAPTQTRQQIEQHAADTDASDAPVADVPFDDEVVF